MHNWPYKQPVQKIDRKKKKQRQINKREETKKQTQGHSLAAKNMQFLGGTQSDKAKLQEHRDWKHSKWENMWEFSRSSDWEAGKGAAPVSVSGSRQIQFHRISAQAPDIWDKNHLILSVKIKQVHHISRASVKCVQRSRHFLGIFFFSFFIRRMASPLSRVRFILYVLRLVLASGFIVLYSFMLSGRESLLSRQNRLVWWSFAKTCVFMPCFLPTFCVVFCAMLCSIVVFCTCLCHVEK